MKYYLTTLIFTLFMGSAFSAHIIGGEMYYTCIGENTYEFTMKLYRDCDSQGAQFDAPARIGIFDEDNNLLFMENATVQEINDVIPDLSSPCLSIPPDICVEEGIYVFIVEFPDNLQAYQVVYQRCCRNSTIQNLNNPGSQGLTIVAEVPALPLDECNSSPSYNNFPPPVLCAQEQLEFDHSATDADGDSLAYSLCAPYVGASQIDPAPSPPSAPPYNPVLWSAGFTAVNPINSDPQFEIDPITGLLTGTPTQLGQFVFGVCVEEWRDGQLLSVNTRDFQFNVAFCEVTSEALLVEPDIEDLCEDLTFTFLNESNPTNEFLWDFGDPSTDLDVSTAYSPTYTYSDTGTYIVTLITNPDFFCSDTATIVLPLYLETSVEVEIASFECIDGVQVFEFEADGNFNQSASTINWDFGPNATPSIAQGLTVDGIVFTDTGPQDVQVEVLNNICTAQDVITVNIPEPPTAVITPQDEFCEGLNYQFSQTSANATMYAWDFGVAGSTDDVSNQPNAGFTFPESGVYTVSLTVQSGDNCPITVTEDFDIQTLLTAEFDNPPIDCFEGNSFSFEAGGSFTSDASFVWTFEGANVALSSDQNPSGISYDAPGVHPVTLSISEHGCTRDAEGEVRIHINPVADFNAFPLAGCVPLEVNFGNLSESESSSISYEWSFGDGAGSDSRNVVHEYTTPGIYTVSLSIENLNGCIDSDSVTKQGLIEVVPSPTASFRVEPSVVSVFNPEVTITDFSEGNSSCSYYFDGQVFEDCDFTHILENVEHQIIELTVTNEFGCSGRAEGEIFISDHIIYVPNSFTPDGDGLNDLFMPVVTGATNIEMHIINRWGKEVYSNKNVVRGWDGSSLNDEEHFTQAEVYQYLIIVTDNLGWNFDYTGSVRLIR
jgi:gliding motility-associated-like protein